MLIEALISGLTSWNLETKLFTIAVDNCSTNDGMVNIHYKKKTELRCNIPSQFVSNFYFGKGILWSLNGPRKHTFATEFSVFRKVMRWNDDGLS